MTKTTIERQLTLTTSSECTDSFVAKLLRMPILPTLTAIKVEFYQNIHVDVHYDSAKFQLDMMCLCY